MTKKKPKSQHKKSGRPTKMTKETINKIEKAFSFGCSDRETCLYADISMALLYDYQKKNPKFLERKALLKETTILKAREVVVRGIENNPEFSLKYLERKRKKEFSTRSEVEMEDPRSERTEKHLEKLSNLIKKIEKKGKKKKIKKAKISRKV